MPDYKLPSKKENLFINILLLIFFVFVFLIILRYFLGAKTLKDSQLYIESLKRILSQGQKPALEQPVLKTTDPRMGSPQAKNIIVVFADFQCPYCADVMQAVDELLAKEQNQLLVIWKDFANPLHPQAKPAALAARCAQNQGKFWEYHDYLFANQDKLGKDLYQEIARQLSLDSQLFNQCLNNQETLPLVEDSFQEGLALKIDGTPYLFVNGQKMSGAVNLEDLEKMVKSRTTF